MIALFALAAAAPLRLAAGPDAAIEVLPVTEPGRVEVLVRGATGLGDTFAGAPADGVRSGRVTDLGGHHVVTVWMEDPATTLAFAWGDGAWEARVRPAAGPPATPVPAPIRALLAGVPDRGCETAPAVPLVPLHGADHQGIPAVAVLAAALPRWEAAEPADVTWERVAERRRAAFLGGAPAPADLYALGALHRDLGHAREAAYYFAAADAPSGVAHLQRAGALGVLGDWDGARAAVGDAAADGADPRDVLAALGTVALASGAPSPAAVGRALVAAGAGPWDGLAGALLVRDGCWTEATVPLARADAPWAHLLLADARLLAGDLRGAEAVLDTLDAPRGLVRSRRRLVALAGAGPAEWPAHVPALDQAAGSADPVEAREARYLLAQIGERLGDDDLALDTLTALVDDDRALVDRDAGARLVAAWARRTGALLAAGADADALSAHLGAWRPGLERHLADPAPLLAVAAAWGRVGLHEEALATLGTAVTVEARVGRDDRPTVLAIADAYLRTGRLPEALDALDFLATRPRDPAVDARAALLRGRVLLATADEAAARAAWATVAGEPPRPDTAPASTAPTPTAPAPEQAEARLRLALLDAEAGRCDGDLDALALPPPDDLAPGRVAAARVGCLAATGRTLDARRVVSESAFADPDTRAWSETAAGVRADGAWARLAAEDAAHAALLARLTPRTGGP